MSTSATRYPLAQAEAIARTIVDLLRSSCLRIEIAGSIRRRKADVGDVEIVCVPKPRTLERDLFGQPVSGQFLYEIDDTVEQLLADGVLAKRLDAKGRSAWGMRYKRALFNGFPLDLFSVVEPAQWGVLLAIRTGPAEFSRRLVTPRFARADGMLPDDCRIQDGGLRRWSVETRREALIPTPEEEDLFRAIGQPWLPPEARA